MIRLGARKIRSRQTKPEDLVQTWKIIRGDLVQVMSGRDAGKQSVVVKVARNKNRIFLRGIKLAKRRMKASEQAQAGVVYKEQPIHYSNVALVDPSDGKPCKIRMAYLPDGAKVRISKRTGTMIPKPESNKNRFKSYMDGPKDTKSSVAAFKTFNETSLVPQLTELDVAKVEEKVLLEKELAEKKQLEYEKARAKYAATSRPRQPKEKEPTNPPSSEDKEAPMVV